LSLALLASNGKACPQWATPRASARTSMSAFQQTLPEREYMYRIKKNKSKWLVLFVTLLTVIGLSTARVTMANEEATLSDPLEATEPGSDPLVVTDPELTDEVSEVEVVQDPVVTEEEVFTDEAPDSAESEAAEQSSEATKDVVAELVQEAAPAAQNSANETSTVVVGDGFDVTSSGGTNCDEDQVVITINNTSGLQQPGLISVNGNGALSNFSVGISQLQPVNLPTDGTPINIVVSALSSVQFDQTFSYQPCSVPSPWPSSQCRDGVFLLIHPGDDQVFRAVYVGSVISAVFLRVGGVTNNPNAVFGELIFPNFVNEVSLANDFNETRSYLRSDECKPTESEAVLPVAPEPVDKCGTAEDGWNIPSSDKVRYIKNTVEGTLLPAGFTTFTGPVSAEPLEGYFFDEGTKAAWNYVFTNVPCIPTETTLPPATTQPPATTVSPTVPLATGQPPVPPTTVKPPAPPVTQPPVVTTPATPTTPTAPPSGRLPATGNDTMMTIVIAIALSIIGVSFTVIGSRRRKA